MTCLECDWLENFCGHLPPPPLPGHVPTRAHTTQTPPVPTPVPTTSPPPPPLTTTMARTKTITNGPRPGKRAKLTPSPEFLQAINRQDTDAHLAATSVNTLLNYIQAWHGTLWDNWDDEVYGLFHEACNAAVSDLTEMCRTTTEVFNMLDDVQQAAGAHTIRNRVWPNDSTSDRDSFSILSDLDDAFIVFRAYDEQLRELVEIEELFSNRFAAFLAKSRVFARRIITLISSFMVNQHDTWREIQHQEQENDFQEFIREEERQELIHRIPDPVPRLTTCLDAYIDTGNDQME